MTIGEKIKRVRTFRGMTQRELGSYLDLGEKAANRLAQYEMGYRVPKKDLLDKIAAALKVNPLCLYEVSGETIEEVMEILFWLEESNPGIIRLFQMQRFAGERCNDSDDPGVYYHDSDSWPAHAPTGLCFSGTALNDFLKEWHEKKCELAEGKISKDEYFEWKLRWPYGCE